MSVAPEAPATPDITGRGIYYPTGQHRARRAYIDPIYALGMADYTSVLQALSTADLRACDDDTLERLGAMAGDAGQVDWCCAEWCETLRGEYARRRGHKRELAPAVEVEEPQQYDVAAAIAAGWSEIKRHGG